LLQHISNYLFVENQEANNRLKVEFFILEKYVTIEQRIVKIIDNISEFDVLLDTDFILREA